MTGLLRHTCRGRPNNEIARLGLSMTYVHAVSRCSTLFRSVLFPICSPTCSQFFL